MTLDIVDAIKNLGTLLFELEFEPKRKILFSVPYVISQLLWFFYFVLNFWARAFFVQKGKE